MPTAAAAPERSGSPGHDREDLAALLSEPLTEGYKPTLPLWSLAPEGTLPQIYLIRDVELMLTHPRVRNVLSYFKSGIHGAEFDVETTDQAVGDFVLKQTQRFWDRGVPLVQGGYDYGWIGCENLYTFDEGPYLAWCGLKDFAPRDTFLLTMDHQPIGVRVKNVAEKGRVDLWLASGDVPGKALWYAHEPRYGSYYGVTACLGMWRPWRRLAWKDGAETTVDGGIYRFAYQGPIGRYPEEAVQTAQAGVPATALDSQGKSRRFARDVMRQICEWYKSGAAVGLPSTKYTQDQGGGDKWGLELPKGTLNVSGLLEYVKYLLDQIAEGGGVPPELLQASETGSGYSGRAIPMEAFLARQQAIADRMLLIFVEQVLRPLVRWNWGWQVRFDIKVKNLLETRRKQQGGEKAETAPTASGQSAPPAQARRGPEWGVPGQRDQGMAPEAPFSLREEFVTDQVRTIARKVATAITRRAA